MTARADSLTAAWSQPESVWGWLTALNHRAIGARFIFTAFVFFVIGGIQALLLRLQLMGPNLDVLTAEQYNQFFTMHGTTMMFLFVVPMAEGFAIYLLPLMLGARDMPFPKLNAFGYFCYLFGGIFLYTSFITGDVPDSGWFSYVPLTGSQFSPGVNLDYWLLGITFVEISAIAAAIEIIVGCLKYRAPGMVLGRMPLFAWTMLAVAFAILLAFPALIAASILLEADRAIGTHIYNVAQGGDPLLWQHLFWVFGHPEVYIIFLPAAGFVSMILPAFARRPVIGYHYVALAALVTAFLSFGLWVHHMFATGLPSLALAFFTAASLAISIPAGIQVFAWIMTIWAGRPVLKTAMLFVIGFLITFVVGGITGVMVAIVPFDLQVHDSFFVVAHFHYVLIGGMVFPLFGAFYYWLPKMTGRLLDEGLGKLNFWTFFIGFNLAFFPMHITGLLGMPRRVYTYQEGLGWEALNALSTVGAFILAGSVLLFIVNVIKSHFRGEPAGDDPWGSNTLEWATTSPPQAYNFRRVPIVRSRDPLWDQEDVFDAKGEERLELDITQSPDGYRQIVMTTMLDAQPERITAIPSLSIWPLIAALGLAVMFSGVLLEMYGLAAAGLGVTVLAVIGWHWPAPSDYELAASRSHVQTHLRPSASRLSSQSGWMGMALFLVSVLAILAAIYFGYFLLWSNASVWPLGDIEAPSVLPGVALTVPLLLAVAGALFARIAPDRQHRGRRVVATGVGVAGGVAFCVFGGLELAGQDFGATTNAYGSIFFAVFLSQACIVALATAISAWIVFRSFDRVGITEMHHVSLENAALTWVFAILTWGVTFAILYVVPHLGTTEPVRL